jgi:Fic family protein
MKTSVTVKWIAALMLAASLTVRAQGPGGGQGGAGQGGGTGGQHQPPTPEKMAERLMTNFDANKDGELSQEELTKAIGQLQQHHPGGPGGGGQGGGAGGGSGSPSQGGQGGHHHPPAGGGAQQGGGQGGQGGQGGEHQGPPPADKIAEKMIEKFSSDKKGLTQAELTKAIEAHRANRGQHGGGQQGGGHQGGPGAGATT